ncbi:MAG TPA: PIN domain-containing protein [Longimicrobium sp.]|jgi:rRNA-processing protein FCF1
MIPDTLLARYRTAGVLVDTNLLLLYFVGALDPDRIPRFKRTNTFTPEDHALLRRFLGRFERVVTTPHILAEVSNLAGELSGAVRDGVFAKFAAGITLMEERHAPAAELAAQPSFPRFGLTDTAVVHHARGRYLVLSDDFRLSQYLQHQGVDVINFNHLRLYNLLQ